MFATKGVLLVNSVLLFIDVVINGANCHFKIPTLLLFLIINVLFNDSKLKLRFRGTGRTRFVNVITLDVVLFSNNVSAGFARVGPVLAPNVILSATKILLATLFAKLFV